jgi:hypothetical protein
MSIILEEIQQTRASGPHLTHPSRARRSYARYSVGIVLVPIIALTASFSIARSSWYLHHQRNSYLAISDYPFTLKDKNCEVLVFGDSSALTGISPTVIEAATSLRTCNIAQPSTTLAIAGNFALDSYLENNARPRFLIFQFSAPDFSHANWDGRLNEEGALQLVRHKFDRQTSLLFARHPLQALEFSEFILRTALVDRSWTTGTYDRSWAQVQSSHGLFTPPGAPLANCVANLAVRAPNAAWIQHLRREYAKLGTRVLVYAAPHPECDNTYEYYSENLAQLTDHPLRRFSIRMFTGENHFTREGADLNSKHIAEDISSGLGE